jgi:hypothetical protein
MGSYHIILLAFLCQTILSSIHQCFHFEPETRIRFSAFHVTFMGLFTWNADCLVNGNRWLSWTIPSVVVYIEQLLIVEVHFQNHHCKSGFQSQVDSSCHRREIFEICMCTGGDVSFVH